MAAVQENIAGIDNRLDEIEKLLKELTESQNNPDECQRAAIFDSLEGLAEFRMVDLLRIKKAYHMEK